MPGVGDKFKSLITGSTYVVKKITGKMVLLERQDGKSQVMTELGGLKLFYEKEEETKSHYGKVNFEKRRHLRFNVDLPIQYYPMDSFISYNGRAINLSEGGILIHSPEQMEKGQHLRSKLSFNLGSEINTIEMEAEVVWMDIYLDEARGDYRSGVKFIDIAQKDKTKLENFLRSLS
jgi:hypothetical protein